MTITLANIYMLTGLRITRSIQPYDFLSAGSKKLAKKSNYAGWASYILNHIGDGSIVDEREHVAFAEYVVGKNQLLWVILRANL